MCCALSYDLWPNSSYSKEARVRCGIVSMCFGHQALVQALTRRGTAEASTRSTRACWCSPRCSSRTAYSCRRRSRTPQQTVSRRSTHLKINTQYFLWSNKFSRVTSKKELIYKSGQFFIRYQLSCQARKWFSGNCRLQIQTFVLFTS